MPRTAERIVCPQPRECRGRGVTENENQQENLTNSFACELNCGNRPWRKACLPNRLLTGRRHLVDCNDTQQCEISSASRDHASRRFETQRLAVYRDLNNANSHRFLRNGKPKNDTALDLGRETLIKQNAKPRRTTAAHHELQQNEGIPEEVQPATSNTTLRKFRLYEHEGVDRV